MECNACQLEMESLLSSMPSKWRDQLVNVICNKIVNQGVSCSAVMSCLSDEMTMIDPGCLTDTQAEWDDLTAIGKLQLIVNKICENLDITTVTVDDTFSINLSGVGSVEDPIIADIIKDPDADNILLIGTTGVYVPPTVMANSDCITWSLSTLDGKRTYTPTLDTACIGADILADFEVEADNGLHMEEGIVYLGGQLVEDTTINATGQNLYLANTGAYIGVSNKSLAMDVTATGVAAPNDEHSIFIVQPGYVDCVVDTATERNVEIAYHAKARMLLGTGIGEELVAFIGVHVPFSLNADTNPSPAEDILTSYSKWVNQPEADITEGHMTTISRHVTFNGISGLFGGTTLLGINSPSTGATTALDVSYTGTAAGFRIRESFTPASASAAGNAGDIAWDANYIYVCIATNTWKRTALTTW